MNQTQTYWLYSFVLNSQLLPIRQFCFDLIIIQLADKIQSLRWDITNIMKVMKNIKCCRLFSILFFKKGLIMFFFFKIYLFIFRERGREGERDGEKHQCVVASHTAPTGDLDHTTQACTLTGNWTGNPLVHRPALNTLNHTRQGYIAL